MPIVGKIIPVSIVLPVPALLNGGLLKFFTVG